MELIKSVRILIPVILLLGLLTSCSVTKSIQVDKVNTDSLVQSMNDSFSRKYNEQIEVHKRELKEARESSVTFHEPVRCPTVNIDSACSKDSMVKVIRQLESIIAGQKSKIRFFKDGSFEAEGQIKEANYKSEKWSLELDSVGQRNEELVKEVNTLKLALSKKEVHKEKYKKSGIPWWWILITFFLTCIFWHNRTKVWRVLRNLISAFKKSTGMMLLTIIAAIIIYLITYSSWNFYSKEKSSTKTLQRVIYI